MTRSIERATLGTLAVLLLLAPDAAAQQAADRCAREVMEMWMVDSAKYCRDLVRSGTRIEGAGIYILEGVRETKMYAERHDLPTVVEHTTEVLEALEH